MSNSAIYVYLYLGITSRFTWDRSSYSQAGGGLSNEYNCDFVIDKKKYIFGLHSHLRHRAPKCLGIILSYESYKGVFCYGNF